LQTEGIEAVRAALEGLSVESTITQGALADLCSKMRANSSQLALLESTVLGSLDDIKETVTQTELLVRDLGQTVMGGFTVVQTDLQSIESRTSVANRALTELLAKVDTVSEQMSGLVSCPSSGAIPTCLGYRH